jgi:hypothetical protein
MVDDPMLFPTGNLANNFAPNPLVRLFGKGPEGATCKTCHHAWLKDYHDKRYWKCELRPHTFGAGTDIRLKWDACARYEEEVEP